MKAIAMMTMAFLPATFFSSFLAMPLFQWTQRPIIQSKFWIFWVLTIPTTLIVFLVWSGIIRREVLQKRVASLLKKLNYNSSLKWEEKAKQARVEEDEARFASRKQAFGCSCSNLEECDTKGFHEYRQTPPDNPEQDTGRPVLAPALDETAIAVENEPLEDNSSLRRRGPRIQRILNHLGLRRSFPPNEHDTVELSATV